MRSKSIHPNNTRDLLYLAREARETYLDLCREQEKIRHRLIRQCGQWEGQTQSLRIRYLIEKALARWNRREAALSEAIEEERQRA